jgi:hypothetical protein
MLETTTFSCTWNIYKYVVHGDVYEYIVQKCLCYIARLNYIQ